MCLSVRVDDRNLDDITSMYGHDWPLSSVILAVVEPVDAGDDGEVASCAGYPCARRAGETNGEGHYPASQSRSYDDDDNCEHLVFQHQSAPCFVSENRRPQSEKTR